MSTRTLRALAIGLGIAALGAGQPGEFEPLVKGTDPGQFRLVGLDSSSISIADGVVSLTGEPDGYFATKDSYEDYVIAFDWRYEPPADAAPGAPFNGNSGLLLHISGEHKVWPKCVEAQLQNADAGHVFGINGAAFESTLAAEARKERQKRAIKPAGEWNEMEVICEGDSIICTLNGVEIDRGAGAAPVGGPIGWQSEGSPIQFRNLRIKRLE